MLLYVWVPGHAVELNYLVHKSGGFFQWGAFGAEGIVLDSNARVDSYDSTLGTYDSQAVNGSHSSQSGQARYSGNSKIPSPRVYART